MCSLCSRSCVFLYGGFYWFLYVLCTIFFKDSIIAKLRKRFRRYFKEAVNKVYCQYRFLLAGEQPGGSNGRTSTVLEKNNSQIAKRCSTEIFPQQTLTISNQVRDAPHLQQQRMMLALLLEALPAQIHLNTLSPNDCNMFFKKWRRMDTTM